jgi:hypothetical protein
MSVRASQWAWEIGRGRELGQGPLLTLLKVADHADQDGVCWPGEKHVADYTSCDERTVRRHLKLLEGEGLLARERTAQTQGRGRAHDRIRLDLNQPANLSGKTDGVQPDTSDASTGQSEQVLPDKSDTGLYREPSKEPSRTNPHSPPGGDGLDLPEQLFELWKSLTGRNGSTQFTPKRRRLTKARIADSSEDELRRAIAGCAGSDFHMKRGRHANRDGAIFDDLARIFKSRDDVEGFAAMPGPRFEGRRQAESVMVMEDQAAIEVWEETKTHLRETLDAEAFDRWIAPLEGVGRRGSDLVLVDSSGRGILSDYRELIAAALAKTGIKAGLEIVDETALELERA